MKGFLCPNCGEKQSVKLKVGNEAALDCGFCKRALLFKVEPGVRVIKIFDNDEKLISGTKKREKIAKAL